MIADATTDLSANIPERMSGPSRKLVARQILGQYEYQGSPEAHPTAAVPRDCNSRERALLPLPIAHSVVLRCGRPVLVVRAAVPLLRLSQSVQIVTIIHPSAQDNEADAKSLLAHLGKHGIEIGTDVLQIRTVEERDSLRKQIEQGHYDLLVIGGYLHPMWLEFIFGGVTQSILLSSKIPVLVSPLAEGEAHSVLPGWRK